MSNSVSEAARISGEMFRAEVAARRAGRQFDQLAAIGRIVEPIAPDLAAATRGLAATERRLATTEARKLAAARAADPDLSARVAARRLARQRGEI